MQELIKELLRILLDKKQVALKTTKFLAISSFLILNVF